jgi:hypothetical protein
VSDKHCPTCQCSVSVAQRPPAAAAQPMPIPVTTTTLNDSAQSFTFVVNYPDVGAAEQPSIVTFRM